MIPYLNTDKIWWNPNASKVFRIGDRQLALAGNFSFSPLSVTACYAFNKAMYEKLGISDDLYQLVSDGVWTVDRFHGIAKQAVKDVNGDGIFDSDDNYGIFCTVKQNYNTLLLSSGVHYMAKDENNYPIFSLPSDKAAIDKIMHIIELNQNERTHYNEGQTISQELPELFFENGHALFRGTSINTIEKMRSMEDDIGIVPSPKYDEQQEKYYAPSYGSELSVLPGSFDLNRADNVGILLEALAFYSEQELMPIYKEVLLKTKYARDNESEEMLDIIFGGIVFELGINVFAVKVADVIMTKLFFTINDNVASALAEMEVSVNAELDKLAVKLKGQEY